MALMDMNGKRAELGGTGRGTRGGGLGMGGRKKGVICCLQI